MEVCRLSPRFESERAAEKLHIGLYVSASARGMQAHANQSDNIFKCEYKWPKILKQKKSVEREASQKN